MRLHHQAYSEGESETMSRFFIYYTEANIVCIILFSIMLFRDIFNVDRQEKQKTGVSGNTNICSNPPATTIRGKKPMNRCFRRSMGFFSTKARFMVYARMAAMYTQGTAI